jgi:hypothetical protein
MLQVDREVSEEKAPTIEAMVKTKKQAIQFIIDHFKNSEKADLQNLVQKAKTIKRKLEQEEFFKAELATKKWARVVREMISARRIEALVIELRNQLNQLLDSEEQELKRKVKLTYKDSIYKAAYEAACHLTLYWPLNEVYLPKDDEDPALKGKPICMITMDVVDPDNRILSSKGDQFDGVALLGWLSRKPTHPKSRQKFNHRDSQQINDFAVSKGFTPPLGSSGPEENSAQPDFPRRGLRFIAASFGLWTLGLILGGAGVSMAVALSFYFLGAAGVLLGACYLLYKGLRAITQATGQLRDEEVNYERYREELDLQRALSLSLVDFNNRRTPSPRNQAMDFLYDRSLSRNPAQSPRGGQRRGFELEEAKSNESLSVGRVTRFHAESERLHLLESELFSPRPLI